MIVLHDVPIPHEHQVQHCAGGLRPLARWLGFVATARCSIRGCDCDCYQCVASRDSAKDLCDGRAHTVEVDFGRPPPPCSNPSSPAYSDPGDPPTVNIYPERCEKCGLAWGSDRFAMDFCIGYAETHMSDGWEPPDPPEYEEV